MSPLTVIIYPFLELIVLASVTSLSISDITSSSVTITLNITIPNNVSISYFPINGSITETLKVTDAENVTLRNLKSGITYGFEVDAFHSDGKRVWNELQATTAPLPPTVEAVRMLGVNRVFISWISHVNSSQDRYDVLYNLTDQGDHVQACRGVEQTNCEFSIANSDRLLPGGRFTVTIYAIKGDQFSQPVYATHNTKPKSPTHLSTSRTNSTLLLSWLRPDMSIYSAFTISLTDMYNSSVLTERFTTLQARAEFIDLIPGCNYRVTVVTVSGSETSAGLSQDIWMLPNPVNNLTITSNTSASGSVIVITWQPPTSGYYSNYSVNITSGVVVVPMVTESMTIVWPGRPGRTFEVLIGVNSGPSRGDIRSARHTTDPLPVVDPVLVAVGPDNAAFNWTLPNTEYDLVEITVSYLDNVSSTHVERQVDQTVSFHDLIPGVTYNVSFVTMVTEGPISIEFYWTFTTEPLPVQDLNATTLSSSAIHISWTSHGHHDGFRISHVNMETGISGWQEFVDASQESYTLRDLLAGHRYNISVESFSNTTNKTNPRAFSSLEYVVKTTKPSIVEAIFIDNLIGGYINISWLPHPRSLQDSYLVSYRTVLNDPDSIPTSNRTTVPYLAIRSHPGEKYEIRVWCLRDGEIGRPGNHSQIIPPLAPRKVWVVRYKSNSTSLYLRWHYTYAHSYVTEWHVSYKYVIRNFSGVVLRPANDGYVEFRVNNLSPGIRYEIQVSAVTEMVQSLVSTIIHATVEPICTSVLTEVTADNRSLTLEYSPSSGKYDQYVISCPIINHTETRSIAQNRTVVIDMLSPGYQYEVFLAISKDNVTSKPKSFNFTTYPNHATVTSSSNRHSVILTIRKPVVGWSDSFDVRCTNVKDNRNCGEKSARVYGLSNQFTFDLLDPFQRYRFTVATRSGAKSVSRDTMVETKQGLPSAVRELRVVEMSPRTVSVSWEIPNKPNGFLTEYKIAYLGTHPNRTNHYGFATTTELKVDIGNLNGGFNYTFEVTAKTVGYGDAADTQLIMKTYSPRFSKGVYPIESRPKLDSSPSLTKFTVNLTNVFSEEFGVIVAYTVIVATDNSSRHQRPATLPSWRMAQNDAAIKAYQVMSNCSDFFSLMSSCGERSSRRRRSLAKPRQVRQFTIGDEDCDRAAPGYCNGPLKPDTVYYVSMRAFTDGGYTDTVYSTPIRTAVKRKPPSGSSVVLIGTIVGCILGGLVIIGLVIFGYCRFIRRVKPCRSVKGTYLTGGRDPSIKLNITRSSLRKPRTSQPVKLKDFPEHIRIMSADSDYRFAEEFEDLKEVGRDQLCTAAELPQNRAKNRFTNILPYDHSRVKLLPTDDEEGSDYINANYIPGYTSRREYIVTQGTLPSTRDDFWRMVWEQNCRNIVMLTKCFEKGREKCDRYWPTSSEAVFYGDLQVAILNETKFYEWTQTEFRVSLGEQSRKVRHFHYLAWPDFGVPEKPSSLVNFVKMFREKVILDAGPIVVHCSAGVGRSGTFISLDRLLQTMKNEDTVDIFRIVSDMRKERVWMVQTEQQYICIHQCVLSMLTPSSNETSDSGGVEVHENVGFEDDEGIHIDVT